MKKLFKKSKKAGKPIDINALPQNVQLAGEHTVQDKDIYINQNVYKEIHRFTRDKTSVETGGMLYGNVIEEFGKTSIIIRGFVEAKHSQGTPTTLTFTHETWDYVYKTAEKKFPEYKMLGWIHTHPNYDIFLSEYDKFIQENFFSGENQIAYVVDPVRNTEGFYFWLNGKLEACKGFFLFDEVGKELDAVDEEEEEEEKKSKTVPPLVSVIIGLLTVAVVVLLCWCLLLNGRINELETKQQQQQQQLSIQYEYLNQLISNDVYLGQALEQLTGAEIINEAPSETSEAAAAAAGGAAGQTAASPAGEENSSAAVPEESEAAVPESTSAQEPATAPSAEGTPDGAA